MPRQRQKKATAAKVPAGGKNARTSPSGDPRLYDIETVVWHLGILDSDGPWGWGHVRRQVWWEEIWPKLRDFESMTWNEILQASGGRASGNNSHPVEVEGLTKKARNRLAEIKQDDVPQLFSLRLSGRSRVYGIRDRRVLKLLWYDPDHGDNSRAVYPVKQK